jgi:hypothetical protein
MRPVGSLTAQYPSVASGDASLTAPEEITPERLRRARLGRRGGISILVLFVFAGLLNAFGSHSASASGSGAGLGLTVDYPNRTRPALPIRWSVHLTSNGGFADPIHIAVNQAYFNYFDFNNFYPTPDSTENRDDLVIFTFAPPTTNTFNVLFDGRTQPGRVGIARAVTKVLDGSGSTLVEVDYTTEVFP